MKIAILRRAAFLLPTRSQWPLASQLDAGAK
jgi:hypothetical protein